MIARPAQRLPKAQLAMAWTYDSEKEAVGEPRLCSRQLECLGLAVQGLTSSQIGRPAGISARMVDQYRGEAYERRGVRSRIQAVMAEVALGLVSPWRPGKT